MTHMTEIRINRSKLYPQVARPGPAWRWSYDYTVDGGLVSQYGPGLCSLMRRLKQRFPDAKVYKMWDSEASS